MVLPAAGRGHREAKFLLIQARLIYKPTQASSAAPMLRGKWNRPTCHAAGSQDPHPRGGWTGRVRRAPIAGSPRRARNPHTCSGMRTRPGHRHTEPLHHPWLWSQPIISPLGLASVSTLTKTLPEGSVISQCLVGGGLWKEEA